MPKLWLVRVIILYTSHSELQSLAHGGLLYDTRDVFNPQAGVAGTRHAEPTPATSLPCTGTPVPPGTPRCPCTASPLHDVRVLSDQRAALTEIVASYSDIHRCWDRSILPIDVDIIVTNFASRDRCCARFCIGPTCGSQFCCEA